MNIEKVWRFIAPPGAMKVIDAPKGDSGVESIDNLLKAYRLPSVAWSDDVDDDKQEPVFLSAGWQSDFSLYEHQDEELVPTAEEFAMMGNDTLKYSKLNKIASSLETLTPSQELLQSFDSNQQCTIWTVVQKPGDMLVIPAYWWHQTYALEPSLAYASQRCGLDRDTPRVLSHIIDTVFGERDVELGNLPTLSNTRSSRKRKLENPREIVSKLLNALAQA